jgi:hypothetical protein
VSVRQTDLFDPGLSAGHASSRADDAGIIYPITFREAEISICQRYRYSLRRTWDHGAKAVLFCMLNPSIADSMREDPTLVRCINFAQRWGFRGLEIVNIFAFISTDPAGLRGAADPVGPANAEGIQRALRRTHATIVAWGAGGAASTKEKFGAAERVALDLLRAADRPIECLGYTVARQPRHPLMLPKTAAREPFLP